MKCTCFTTCCVRDVGEHGPNHTSPIMPLSIPPAEMFPKKFLQSRAVPYLNKGNESFFYLFNSYANLDRTRTQSALLFGRDSGILELYYRRISAVKQCKPLQGSQSIIFFEFSRVSPGAHPLTKKPEDSGYEIVLGAMSNSTVRC